MRIRLIATVPRALAHLLQHHTTTHRSGADGAFNQKLFDECTVRILAISIIVISIAIRWKIAATAFVLLLLLLLPRTHAVDAAWPAWRCERKTTMPPHIARALRA